MSVGTICDCKGGGQNAHPENTVNPDGCGRYALPSGSTCGSCLIDFHRPCREAYPKEASGNCSTCGWHVNKHSRV